MGGKYKGAVSTSSVTYRPKVGQLKVARERLQYVASAGPVHTYREAHPLLQKKRNWLNYIMRFLDRLCPTAALTICKSKNMQRIVAALARIAYYKTRN